MAETPRPSRPFQKPEFDVDLREWLEAGASAKDRDSTMRVLKSSLQFSPQRPRTSGGRPGSSSGKSSAAIRAINSSQSARGRPHSIGTFSGVLGETSPPVDFSSAKPSPHMSTSGKGASPRPPVSKGEAPLPPKPPRSPDSVLQVNEAMASPPVPAPRPPSAGITTAQPLLSVGNGKVGVFSERPTTAKVVEQRYKLRPATSGPLRPTNSRIISDNLPGRQTLHPTLAPRPTTGRPTTGKVPGMPGMPMATRPPLARPPLPPQQTVSADATEGASKDEETGAGKGEEWNPQTAAAEDPDGDDAPKSGESQYIDFTTNKMFYGIQEVSPEIYAELLEISKPEQVDNRNFSSQYDLGGDGFDAFMKNTSYGEANELVANTISGSSAAQERSFATWMQRQKLYYSDLLSEEGMAKVNEWLQTASDDERAEYFQVMRTMHATVDPNKHKSITHLDYHAKVNPMRPEDLNLILEENRFATYGRPKIRDVNVTVGRPGTPLNVGPRPGTAAIGGTHHPPSSYNKGELEKLKKELNLKAELYESKVPLKWACSNLGPVQSTYTAQLGADMAQLRRYMKEASDVAAKKMLPIGLCPTLGFGKVDPLLYQHKTAAFPVANHYMAPLRPHAGESGQKPTTYSIHHGTSAPKLSATMTQDDRDALAKVAAVEEMRMKEFHERVKKSYVPLGSSAIHNQVDPKTMYQTSWSHYGGEVYEANQNDESSSRFLAAFNGPTASVAACAPAEGHGLPDGNKLLADRNESRRKEMLHRA